MILTLFIIAIVILLILLVLAMGMLIGVDFRTVFDVNQDIMIIEVYVFKRLRIARFRARVYADNLYIKLLSKPYRKLSWLVERFDKNSTNSKDSTRLTDKKVASKTNAITPIKLKSLSVNVILGTEDAFLTSILWGGVGMLLGMLDEMTSKRLVIKKYSTHYKPYYYGSEFVLDVSLGIGFWELVKVVEIIKGKKQV